jgi:Mor family transcriptional regulator
VADNRDIVSDMIQALMALAPEFRHAEELEQRLRHHWGGDSHYIAKSAVQGRRQAIQEALSRGEKPQVVQSRYGISRATIYRLMKR